MNQEMQQVAGWARGQALLLDGWPSWGAQCGSPKLRDMTGFPRRQLHQSQTLIEQGMLLYDADRQSLQCQDFRSCARP